MKVRQALQAFDKLGMEIREGRDTLAFFRWGGQVILWTKVPHKRGELKGKLLNHPIILKKGDFQ